MKFFSIFFKKVYFYWSFPLICFLFFAILYFKPFTVSFHGLVLASDKIKIGEPLQLEAKTTTNIFASPQYQFSSGQQNEESNEWSSTSQKVYRYKKPGHYFVSVKVINKGKVVGFDKKFVTVLKNQTLSHDNRRNSPIIFDPETKDVWVVNPDNDSISLIKQDRTVQEYQLSKNCHPINLAIANNEQKKEIWVTCRDNDNLLILDRSGETQGRINFDYGSSPTGLIISNDNRYAYVSLFGEGAVIKLDLAKKNILAKVKLDYSARSMALTHDNTRLLVTRFISPENQGEVWDLFVGSDKMSLQKTIIIPIDNTSEYTEKSGRGVPNYLSAIAIDPSNKYALITANKSNTLLGCFVSNEELNPEHINRAMLAKIDLETGVEIFEDRRDIDNRESPSAVTFLPDGDYSLLALQGASYVTIYDELVTDRNDHDFHSVLANLPVELAPQGIAYDSENNLVMTHNFMDRSVTFIELGLPPYKINTKVNSKTYKTVFKENLSPPVLLGKQLFYNAHNRGEAPREIRMSFNGYQSCATCHFDGMQDGRIWDRTCNGEGLRNTIDLRGKSGLGHGPLHWTANFDEVQDFENDIREVFGGSGFATDQDYLRTQHTLGSKKAGLSKELDALAAYVSSLGVESLPRSPFRNPNGSNTESANSGGKLFQQAGCDSCHSGSNFTDSNMLEPIFHNVGTIQASSGKRMGAELKGIDTPTLLGIWATAPYFHNGSAKTLEDVFRKLPSKPELQTHFNLTSKFTKKQKQDLVQYLKELDAQDIF